MNKLLNRLKIIFFSETINIYLIKNQKYRKMEIRQDYYFRERPKVLRLTDWQYLMHPKVFRLTEWQFWVHPKVPIRVD